ncbi:gsl2621 [Gloeobacter violaceus PCC 7421]|uniref:Gsl2621 protein n=1 Tax=Gloeobacter violaceus (strain ATCC 29082 / PCC 7421) TaxID=251221 RepID=Q7NHB6_GLOVI|nr:gsl2621 [Gloeobacter violaceus PCC 7421]
MSWLCLYVDEDAGDKAVVRALRERGADVVTYIDVGMIQHSDEEHLLRATELGCALYSFNPGFRR